MTISPQAKAIALKANKKYGPGTVVVGSEITQPMLQRLSTGSLSLDVVLNGGWVTNQWIEVIGNESVGKTMIVLKTIALHQRRDPNWTVVWFAAEAWVEQYAVMLGCDISRIIIIESHSMELVFDLMIEYIDERAVDCVVLDSLPALVSTSEDEGSVEDYQPGRSAILTGKFFRKSGGIKGSLTIATRPMLGFIINQLRSTFAKYGDPNTTPGGRGKNYVYFQRVEVKREEWIMSSKEKVGQKIKVVNVKNKVGRPRLEAYIDYYFTDYHQFRAGDWDEVKDIRDAALALGVIERAGAMYSFRNDKWKGGIAMERSIRTRPILRSNLRKATLRVANPALPVANKPVAKKGVKKVVRSIEK